jgi:hypothetical protein
MEWTIAELATPCFEEMDPSIFNPPPPDMFQMLETVA